MYTSCFACYIQGYIVYVVLLRGHAVSVSTCLYPCRQNTRAWDLATLLWTSLTLWVSDRCVQDVKGYIHNTTQHNNTEIWENWAGIWTHGVTHSNHATLYHWATEAAQLAEFKYMCQCAWNWLLIYMKRRAYMYMYTGTVFGIQKNLHVSLFPRPVFLFHMSLGTWHWTGQIAWPYWSIHTRFSVTMCYIIILHHTVWLRQHHQVGNWLHSGWIQIGSGAVTTIPGERPGAKPLPESLNLMMVFVAMEH